MIVNLYKQHFLSSNFSSQSNKKVLQPSTFPLLQLEVCMGWVEKSFQPNSTYHRGTT